MLQNHLWQWHNLQLAWQKASRGKRGKEPAAAFEYCLADNLLSLQEELMTENYQLGEYHSFYIHEPKKRLISAAPFRDRVVHHALCNITTPYFEKKFIPDSYANRVGKGTHRALDRCQQFARRYQYYLQCDIVQFFPSIEMCIASGRCVAYRLRIREMPFEKPTCNALVKCNASLESSHTRILG